MSSVLDRVKLFLPVIAKANEELAEVISAQGADAVRIDGHLAPSAAAGIASAKGDESDAEQDEEEDGNNVVGGAGQGGDPRVVQLEFALGDFDDTPIAQAEAAAGDDGEGAAEQQQPQQEEKEEVDVQKPAPASITVVSSRSKK